MYSEIKIQVGKDNPTRHSMKPSFTATVTAPLRHLRCEIHSFNGVLRNDSG